MFSSWFIGYSASIDLCKGAMWDAQYHHRYSLIIYVMLSSWFIGYSASIDLCKEAMWDA